jgi:hypothetical protein
MSIVESYKCSKCGGRVVLYENQMSFYCQKDGYMQRNELNPITIADAILLFINESVKLGMQGYDELGLKTAIKATFLQMKKEGFYVGKIPTDGDIDNNIMELEKRGAIKKGVGTI